MYKLFMCLLFNLQNHGHITAANLCKGGKWASFEVENENEVYSITITREEKANEETKN